MHKKGILTLTLGLLAALVFAALAFGAGPATVRVGNLALRFDAVISPKTLPKHKPIPISLDAKGSIGTTDGSKTPPVTEVLIDTDKAGIVDAKGVPACTQRQLEARTSAQAEAACGPAILGDGTTGVEVAFPESKPVMLHSKLLAFNGGEKGGVTTIYVHAYLSTPVAAALVTTVKISREQKGPYGLHTVVTIPQIAAYAGSVRDFSLTFAKKLFSYQGQKHSYLLASCPTGKLVAQAETIFHDGPKIGPARISTVCTPKG